MKKGKKKRECPTCGNKFRIGRVVTIADHDGTPLRNDVVCLECEGRAIKLVVPKPATLAPPCRACKREPSCYCAMCVERLGEAGRELVAANIALREGAA